MEVWRHDELAALMEIYGEIKKNGASGPHGTVEQSETPKIYETDEDKVNNENGTESLSKNALKRLQKVTKVKKEKIIPVTKADAEKKEKKPKKEKEPEIIFEDTTPLGSKKVLTSEFPPTYQPKYVESAWQSWWETCGFYKPDVENALTRPYEDKFVMVIPPPNVTGSLHLGHALTTAVEDTLTRWHRMNGKVALWVPGTDHAGIATQSVVEKRLKKDEGLSRHQLGRDEFVRRVWEWKEMYGNKITQQIRCLGASVDWSREAFTMDSNLSRAVTEAFVRFHEDGLLYRDTRLINWSCALQSAISEIEVDYVDLEGRTLLSVPNHKLKEKYEFGTLTSFAYKVIGSESDEEIVVATTRLETMLGDTAVAVHPDDPRYTHLHGKLLQHPFVDRTIPVITDGVLVDMAFGTGAVKITPAHDPNDYQCGKRNGLDFVIVLTEDGKIANNGGKFAGLMRYDAREAIEAELQSLGLFRGKDNNKMRLGLCSRSGDIIEPMLTPQWYVNCTSMAQRAVDAVRNGDLKIIPSMHESTWYSWLENIRDWCVSRQLWWGHRIPAYFVRIQGEVRLDKNDPANSARWIVARTEEQAKSMAAAKLVCAETSIVLEQDEDVLDTWFSSGLFPFSVFGWPNNTDDFKAFYPTSLLETGLDILFFWVARMVMMGLHLTDTLPFTTVYLHAMVRDKYGRKMSKSLGNVIDPLEVINGCSLSSLVDKIKEGNLPAKEVEKACQGQEQDFPDGIPECGADALRFGLLAYTVQGRDVNLDIKRVVGYRQFCNKLWNAVRFALTYLTDLEPTADMHLHLTSSPDIAMRDRYILSQLAKLTAECQQYMSEYNFGAVTSILYSFFLYEFCDVYLEMVKPAVGSGAPIGGPRTIAQATLYTCLEHFLRLLHPLMPFVTEELWQRLPHRERLSNCLSIMVAPYPTPANIPADWVDESADADMKVVKDAIHDARSIRSDYKVPNHVKVSFLFKSTSVNVVRALTAQSQDFCILARAASLTHLPVEADVPKGSSVKVVSEFLTLVLDMAGLIDTDAELHRLTKEKEMLSPLVEQYRRKMLAPDYETKVPVAVQTANREKLAAYEAELAATEAAIKLLV